MSVSAPGPTPSPYAAPAGSHAATGGATTAVGGPTPIDDAQDPIAFLENAVLKASGKTKIDQVAGFKLHGNYEKEGGSDSPVKLYTYRNPPSPDCYCFNRKWTITYKDDKGNDQTLAFTKKIYTNIEVPNTYDGNAHLQKEYMASIAASMYVDVVEAIVRGKAGQQSTLFHEVKHHISKIQHDRFVEMELFTGNKVVQVNPKNRAGPFKERIITHVRLAIRPGNRELNRSEKVSSGTMAYEYEDPSTPIIKLADKVNKHKINYETKLKARKFVLHPGDTASKHVREVADIEKAENVKKNILAGAKVHEALGKARINEKVFWDVLSGQNERLQVNWSDRNRMFNTPEAFDAMLRRYGEGKPISDRIKEFMTPDPAEKKKKKKPAVYEENAMLTRLEELKKQSGSDKDPNKEMFDLSPQELKELELIESCMKASYKDMQKISKEMEDNEKLLKGIGTAQNDADLAAKTESRNKMLEDLKLKFAFLVAP